MTEKCKLQHVVAGITPDMTKNDPTLYTIKPLEWFTRGVGYGIAHAQTNICWYDIRERSSSPQAFCWASTNLGGNDIARGEFVDTIDEAKAQAEKHYREQLGKCLEVWK